MKKLARIDYDSFKKQRELLFIDYDKKVMDRKKIRLPEVRAYYHERLLILNALQKLKNKPTIYTGKMRSNRRIRVENAVKEEANTGALTIGNQEEKEQTAQEKIQLIENALNFLNDKEDTAPQAEETIAEKINEGAKRVYNIASFLVGGEKKYKKRRSF